MYDHGVCQKVNASVPTVPMAYDWWPLTSVHCLFDWWPVFYILWLVFTTVLEDLFVDCLHWAFALLFQVYQIWIFVRSMRMLGLSVWRETPIHNIWCSALVAEVVQVDVNLFIALQCIALQNAYHLWKTALKSDVLWFSELVDGFRGRKHGFVLALPSESETLARDGARHEGEWWCLLVSLFGMEWCIHTNICYLGSLMNICRLL